MTAINPPRIIQSEFLTRSRRGWRKTFSSWKFFALKSRDWRYRSPLGALPKSSLSNLIAVEPNFFTSLSCVTGLTACFGSGIALSWIVGTLSLGAIVLNFSWLTFTVFTLIALTFFRFTANCSELKIYSTSRRHDAFPSIDTIRLAEGEKKKNIPRRSFSCEWRGSHKFSLRHDDTICSTYKIFCLGGLALVHVIHFERAATAEEIRISYDPRYQLRDIARVS